MTEDEAARAGLAGRPVAGDAGHGRSVPHGPGGRDAASPRRSDADWPRSASPTKWPASRPRRPTPACERCGPASAGARAWHPARCERPARRSSRRWSPRSATAWPTPGTGRCCCSASPARCGAASWSPSTSRTSARTTPACGLSCGNPRPTKKPKAPSEASPTAATRRPARSGRGDAGSTCPASRPAPAFRSVNRHGHLGTKHLSDRALADMVKRRATRRRPGRRLRRSLAPGRLRHRGLRPGHARAGDHAPRPLALGLGDAGLRRGGLDLERQRRSEARAVAVATGSMRTGKIVVTARLRAVASA